MGQLKKKKDYPIAFLLQTIDLVFRFPYPLSELFIILYKQKNRRGDLKPAGKITDRPSTGSNSLSCTFSPARPRSCRPSNHWDTLFSRFQASSPNRVVFLLQWSAH